jgi:hypothetical protein
MPDYFCWMIVTEPLTDDELSHLARTGDPSGHPFVSVCMDADALCGHGKPAPLYAHNGIGRRICVQDALNELGIVAYGFDEYGVKTLDGKE